MALKQLRSCIAILLILSVNLALNAQDTIPKHSIGISLLQFQKNSGTFGFRFTPIENIGLSYERRIKGFWTVNVEAKVKFGIDQLGCIDCPGAVGKMTEWNFKLGVNRYFVLSEKINVFAQLQIFKEKTNVPKGVADWAVIGGVEKPWFRFVDYRGLELGVGGEYKVFKSFFIYANTSLQLGRYDEVNSLWERPGGRYFNYAILESIGMKYKF